MDPNVTDKNKNNHEDTENQQLTLLKQIISGLTTTLDIGESIDTILKKTVSITDTDAGMVLLCDNATFTVFSTPGIDTEAIRKRASEQGPLIGFPDYNHGQVFIEDLGGYNEGIEGYLKSLGFRYAAAFPVTLRGEYKGTAVFAGKGKNGDPDRERLTLELSAEYISFALLNSSLYEETLNLKEELQTRFERMPAGCIVMDGEFTVQSWNPEAENIFGYKRDEACGRKLDELVVPAGSIENFGKVKQMLQVGQVTDRREHINITKDGNEIYCEWSSTPLGVKDGNVTGIISMVQDITEKKRLQQQLEERIEEITRKNNYEMAIRNISSGVHSSIDLDDVIEDAVSLIQKNINRADNVALYLIEDNVAVLRSSRGYPEWFLKKVERIPYPRGFTWKAMIEGKPRYVDDVEHDEAIGQAGRDVGTKSYAALPLKYGDEVVGIININSYSRDVITDQERDFLENMTTHVEIAISNGSKVEQLRKTEQIFSSFMQHFPGAAFIKDAGGKYIYINDGFEKEFGIRREDIIGRTAKDVYSPERAERLGNNDENVFMEGSSIQHVEKSIVGDRTRYWLVYKFPITTSEADTPFIGCIAVDITERKEVEEKVRRQAELLDISSDAIISAGLDGTVLYHNRSAERLYKWRSEYLSGKKLNELTIVDGSQLEQIFDIIRTAGEWEGELIHVLDDGTTVTVESRWTLVVNENGEPESIFIVETDISERKEIQKQLFHAQRLESLGTLAGGIAHDLNNTLQPILMSIQLLRNLIAKDDKKHQDWIDILENSAQRGASLVRQILVFARSTQGEYDTLEISAFLKEIVKVIRQTFPISIDITLDLPEGKFTVRGDITRLHQVIMNICVNASQAMPDGGKLFISVTKEYVSTRIPVAIVKAKAGNYIVISISDTGKGIRKEDIDRIFDPFFTTKAPGEGTGLGLSTAYTIVKEHGGFINISSEPGRGSKFKVYLPEITDSVLPEEATENTGLSSGRGETVLVVDDEAAVRDITHIILADNGYRVVTAADGSEAVAMYMKNKGSIDLVIIDLMMPVMDGISTIRTLKKIDPHVKMIISSGFSERGRNIPEVAGTLADASLSKPYSAEILLKTVAEVLGQK